MPGIGQPQVLSLAPPCMECHNELNQSVPHTTVGETGLEQTWVQLGSYDGEQLPGPLLLTSLISPGADNWLTEAEFVNVGGNSYQWGKP